MNVCNESFDDKNEKNLVCRMVYPTFIPKLKQSLLSSSNHYRISCDKACEPDVLSRRKMNVCIAVNCNTKCHFCFFFESIQWHLVLQFIACLLGEEIETPTRIVFLHLQTALSLHPRTDPAEQRIIHHCLYHYKLNPNHCLCHNNRSGTWRLSHNSKILERDELRLPICQRFVKITAFAVVY